MASEIDSEDIDEQNLEEIVIVFMGEFVEETHPTFGKASMHHFS